MHQTEIINASIQNVEKSIVDINSKGKLNDLDCGDLVIRDSGDMGFDVYRKDGSQVMFLNKVGERVLLDWLIEKNRDNAPWIEMNFNRVKEENGSWRCNDTDK